MKIKHFLSAAALCAAGTTFSLADTENSTESLTGTIATWATQNSSVLTDSGTVSSDGYGTYGGIVFNLITSSWLETSTDINIKNEYTLSNISITIEGSNKTNDTLWATSGAKAILSDAAGNIVALSASGTVSGTLQTWTNFTGTDGNAFMLDANQTYYISFVTSTTTWSSTGTLTSGSFVVSERLAGYSNSSISDTDTSTGLLNAGTTSAAPHTVLAGSVDYSPGLSITGTLTETVAAATEDKGTLNLYLLTGQSNSLGAVKGNPLSEESLAAHATTKDQVMYWHENFRKDSTVYDGYSTEWEAVAPAEPSSSSDGYAGNKCMGPEYGFAYLVAKNGWQSLLSGNDGDFGIIKASLDGGDNSYWEIGGNGWCKVLTAANDAILQAYKDGYTTINIVGLMYLQGESNTSAEASTAGTTLLTLVDNLQTAIANIGNELGITVTFDDDYHVAAGESATWTNTTSEAISTASAASIKAAVTATNVDGTGTVGEFIPTRDLTKITSGDALGVHYDGQSQLTIGARYAYAEALRKGLVISNQMIRNFDMDATLADSAAFHSGTRNETMVATWDIASATITNVGDGIVKLYGMQFDADGSNYMQTGATQIAGTVSVAGTDDLDAGTARLVIGKGGINAEKNVLLNTNVGAAGTQTWNVADGVTLTIAGTLFVELGAENFTTALITKTGAGTLTFEQTTIAVILDISQITEIGEYKFKIIEDGVTTVVDESTATASAQAATIDENGIVSLASVDNLTLTEISDPYGELNYVLVNQAEVEAKFGTDSKIDFSSGTLTITVAQIIPEPSLFGLFAGTLALFLAGTRRRSRR